MRFTRFSIAGLLMVVLACALGFAALRSESDLAADAVFTGFLGLLIFAALGVWGRLEPKRSFWRGFAIVGCGYAILSFGPWFETEVQPHLVTTHGIKALNDYLRPKEAELVLTTPAVAPPPAPVAVRVSPAPQSNTLSKRSQATTPARSAPPVAALPAPSPQPAPPSNLAQYAFAPARAPTPVQRTFAYSVGGGTVSLAVSLDDKRFLRVGHSLCGLCLALAGGLLSLFWFAQTRSREQSQPVLEPDRDSKDPLQT